MKIRSVLGEGLLAAADGSLWWVDIATDTLFRRLNETTNSFKLTETASKVLAVNGSDVVLLSGHGVSIYNILEKTLRPVGDRPISLHKNAYRTNDGLMLRDNVVVYGRMLCEPRPRIGDIIFCKGGVSKKVYDGVSIPNTFVLLDDKRTLLVSDSSIKRTLALTLDMTSGEVLNESIWHDFSGHKGTPDGGIVSADGAVYIAMWGGAAIVKLDQDGNLLEEYSINALQPTSLAFASGSENLYVTSATEGLSQSMLDRFPLSGETFEVPL